MTSDSNKQSLGQFFTTNASYILSGFETVVLNKSVVDPFAGNGDLLDWASKNGAISTKGYDIDCRISDQRITTNNSLLNMPSADMIITNPPYLSKNKMSVAQKEMYNLTGYDDLYLLSIAKIINSQVKEGILIVPVNFFSADNSDIVRKTFLNSYKVEKVNYFKERVFADTSYNVVSFHFYKKEKASANTQIISFITYPENSTINFELEERFSYRIAGNDLDAILRAPKIKIIRLTEKIMYENVGLKKVICFFNNKRATKAFTISSKINKQLSNNIILLNCVDNNGGEKSWIKAEDIRKLKYQYLVGKKSSRSFAHLILPDISLAEQEKIIALFNQTLNDLRKKYNSLFLTNFRDNDRKRISFEMCNQIISYCYHIVKC